MRKLNPANPKDWDKLGLRVFDAAEVLDSEEAIEAYLEECAGSNDPALILSVIGTIARARGITELARKTGLTREGIYKALYYGGQPQFDTVMRLVNAMGLHLALQPAPSPRTHGAEAAKKAPCRSRHAHPARGGRAPVLA
jgi:probable addiction module antidote protein